jgi:hypothetical protein
MTESKAPSAPLGFECHDCGEIYPPGVSTAPCVDERHDVGPFVACDLPDAPDDQANDGD